MKHTALYYRILSYQPENLILLKKTFHVIELDSPCQDANDTLDQIEVLFAPLGYVVDAAKMDLCSRLRVISSNTTGVPHIDLEAAAARGIVVCALHDESEFLDSISATAEHTIGLILAAWRRVPAAHAAATAGAWERWSWGAPAMLSRMRLGIVGYGRLGRKVAEIGRALGMDVAYYDPHVPGGIDDLLMLARRSDILSLHAEVNEETRGLVGHEVINALPFGAMVVNTARGELLDTEALLDRLESGRLRCAALDVIDGEYEPGFAEEFRHSRLARYARDHDNLLLTPHIGGSTVDAWTETQRRVIEKTARVLAAAG